MAIDKDFFSIFRGTAEFYAMISLVGGCLALGVGYFVWPASLGGELVYTKLGLIVCVGLICAVTKRVAAGGQNVYTANLKGKTIVVTGAATGIGMQTVRELAKLGGTVIIAARGGTSRLDAAVKEARAGLPTVQANNISAMNLDLSSFTSIHTFVQEFLAEHTRLHVLMNNAGVMMCPYAQTEDGLEMQIGTNHFGHFLLTNLLLDTLIASKAKIVNLASIGHALTSRLTYPRQNDPAKYDQTVAYADSKLANILFTTELQRRYGAKGINAYAVHPGVVKTELGRHINPILTTLLLPIQYLTNKTALQGAQTTLYTILSPHAVPGGYHCDATHWRTTDAAKDAEKAREFWEESERVTKIN